MDLLASLINKGNSVLVTNHCLIVVVFLSSVTNHATLYALFPTGKKLENMLQVSNHCNIIAENGETICVISKIRYSK